MDPIEQTMVSPAVEDYARDHSEAAGPVLEALRKETFEHVAHAQMQVGPLEGAFLRLMVRLVGARRVVELGTFTGYSALCMAEGLPDDGVLVTCDLDPKTGAIAQRYWAQSPHGRKIRQVLGPAIETLAMLEGPFDLAFVDADKESYLAYYEALLPLMRPGGLLVIDNTLWSGRVLDPKSDTDRVIAAFNDHVAADARVEKVLLTLRDGVTLARKR